MKCVSAWYHHKEIFNKDHHICEYEKCKKSRRKLIQGNIVSTPILTNRLSGGFRKERSQSQCIQTLQVFSYEYHDTEGGPHRFDSDYDGNKRYGVIGTLKKKQVACLKKIN
jgi:hypothetical protein